MPWINDKIYIETDLRQYSDQEIRMRIFYVIYYYRQNRTPEMPDIQPTLAEGEALLEAYSRVAYVKTHYGRGGEKGKEKLRLRKDLNRLAEQWGAYYIEQIHAGRIDYFMTAFEYFNMDQHRKPGSTSTFTYDTDWRKGTMRLSCRKKPAVLTEFHWEASDDGGVTWKKLGKTRNPHFTTKKLDLTKSYRLRMFASNPKGVSEVVYQEYRGRWG